MKLKNICVFCGSNPGKNPEFKKSAIELGKLFAKNNIHLVYGGANVGLMKYLADSIIDNNGTVTGIITKHLASKNILYNKVDDIIIVDTMHQRKAKMAEIADGFIALPGGFGTLEELFEIITLSQLELHSKPAGVLNINGFYNHLELQLKKMVDEKLLLEPHRKMLLFSDNMNDLLEKMHNYNPPKLNKWIDDIIQSS